MFFLFQEGPFSGFSHSLSLMVYDIFLASQIHHVSPPHSVLVHPPEMLSCKVFVDLFGLPVTLLRVLSPNGTNPFFISASGLHGSTVNFCKAFFFFFGSQFWQPKKPSSIRIKWDPDQWVKVCLNLYGQQGYLGVIQKP